MRGMLTDAVEFFQRVVTTLAGARVAERFHEHGPPAKFARALLDWTLAELGRFDEAVAVGEESLRMAQAINEPFTLMHGYFGVGIPYLARATLPVRSRRSNGASRSAGRRTYSLVG